jgi:hypothetical protein
MGDPINLRFFSVDFGGAWRALCESNPMVQTNTESIHFWSCRAQWPFSQSTVSKVRQSMSDYCVGMKADRGGRTGGFKPVADDECWIALIETVTTKHTGDIVVDKTKTLDQQLS